jgi:hypothetical protein
MADPQEEKPMTATQIREDIAKYSAEKRDPAETLLDPLVDATLRILRKYGIIADGK